MILSCDPAGKAGIKNDNTAITVVGVDTTQLYLLQVARGHWTMLEMQSQIIAPASQWVATQVIIENTASGMGLVQLLQSKRRFPSSENIQKMTRKLDFSRHQGRFEAGRILLPTEASWLADFESELLAFPNGRHDDQVDALFAIPGLVFEKRVLPHASRLPRTHYFYAPAGLSRRHAARFLGASSTCRQLRPPSFDPPGSQRAWCWAPALGSLTRYR